MKYELLALLTDRPDDIDWSILDLTSPAVLWVKGYYEDFGTLPTLELFAQECLDEGEKPISTAPWSYYVREAHNVQFVQEATKYLEIFNRTYADDPQKAILALRDQFAKLNEPNSVLQPADIAAQTKERWERFGLRHGSRIKTGLVPFDEASGGLSPDDEFMILSARLGQGKSFILHFIALEMAKQGLNVGLYSGEMSEDEVGSRIDTWLTHVSNFDLTRGKFASSDDQVAAYAEQVPGKILVITPKHLGHNAAPADLRKFCKDNLISVMLIDQLSLMQPDGRLSAESHENFAALSMQLKTLQQELRIPFVAVSQLGRAAQQEEVNAAHIAGSDRIGQDATIVLSLERKDNELTIKVLKARSFKRPERGWTFTWDINLGVLTQQVLALDSIHASQAAATAQDVHAANLKENQPLQDRKVTITEEPYEGGRDTNDIDFG